MRNQTEFNGYILTDAERGARQFTKVIGMPILVLLLIFFVSKTLKNWDNIVMWGVSSLWFIIVIYAIFNFRGYQIFDNMNFYVADNIITNTGNAKTENLIALSNQFHITTLSVEFGYGKSTQIRVFYLFSYQSFSIDDIRGSGLHTLKYLTQNKIVIIPKNKETDEWIQNELRIGNIPEFPTSVVINPVN